MGRKDILDIISAAKEQTSVVFSTHILSDVERICGRVAFLEGGRTVFSGSIEEIHERQTDTGLELTLKRTEDAERVLEAFSDMENSGGRLIFKKASDKKAAELMAFLAAQQIPVMRLERHEADLEDMFMEVVGK